jgi:hypothetical protein
MPFYLNILIILWIVIVVTAYLLIRSHRPEWVGLGKDFNKQKIDGVRYLVCPMCTGGTLEPKFKWWQYCIGVTLPPGIMYIAGNPYILICSNCNFKTAEIEKRKLFTRISLTHKLSKEFFISFGVDLAIGLLLLTIWFNI